MFDELTDEQIALLRQDPRQYAVNFRRHPQDPTRKYDFKTTDGETKINYLLHDDGPLNPQSWGNINVLKFARGCLKSTTMRLISAWALHMYLTQGVEIYMTAPREDQITNLTDDLRRDIREVGLEQFRAKDNQMFQKFEVLRETESGDTIPVHAKFEADSGWGEGDALRGPHSHIGIIDEFQDISKAAFDTYVQCIDQSLPGTDLFPVIFIIGTPKLKTSFFADLWEQTDQKEWDSSSLSYEAQSSATEYLPSEEVLDEMDIEVDDVDPYTVRGWHVDQYNSPLHDERAIARDRANFSEMKFVNEVEARFYAPEDNLLSREHVDDAFDASRGFVDSPRYDSAFVTLAADWGGGDDKNAADTVFAATEWLEHEDGSVEAVPAKITFFESISRNEAIRKFEQWLIDYEVRKRGVACIDYGHAEGIMEDLQDGNHTINEGGYPKTVKAARFGNIKDKTQIKWEQNSGKRRFFTCDKTRSVSQMVDDFKSGVFSIPKNSLSFAGDGADGVKLVNQLTAPHKEMQTTPSGSKKIRIEKPENRNDDAFDVLTFSWLGYNELGPQNLVTDVTVNKRRGYA
jgi:hypothetical protein